LRGVAQIVESSIRHVDLAARYGDEEFAVILVDTGAEAGLRVAERIRRRVARDHRVDADGLTISIGTATYPAGTDSAERVIDQADWAMYQAKRLGRDVWHLGREEFFARVRRTTRLPIEPDVLEDLAAVVLAQPAEWRTTIRRTAARRTLSRRTAIRRTTTPLRRLFPRRPTAGRSRPAARAPLPYIARPGLPATG
jgi:predicted signal transduction protein with EAL and GGDEF domain